MFLLSLHLYGVVALNNELENVSNMLESIGVQIVSSWPHETTFTASVGWHCPAITKHDLAEIPRALARRIRTVNVESLSDQQKLIVAGITERLNVLSSSTLPYVFNGNAAQALPAFIQTFNTISQLFEPIIGTPFLKPNWDELSSDAVPAVLQKRANRIKEKLDANEQEIDSLVDKIKSINDAHETAEALPETMRSLEKKKETINKVAEEISDFHKTLKDQSEAAAKNTAEIVSHEIEAAKLVKRCDEYQRIATSIGLSAAFHVRADDLKKSMYLWVSGLVLALYSMAMIGGERVKVLSEAISKINPDWGIIGMNMLLSLLSIGAPLWFAWIATKQIGQRFRLAEDYAYKASIAKAYEGYRREAVQLDPQFEKRLFSIALTRLEEAPLRLMETTTHGSPLHELSSSDGVKNSIKQVLEIVSDVKDAMVSVIPGKKQEDKKIDSEI